MEWQFVGGEYRRDGNYDSAIPNAVPEAFDFRLLDSLADTARWARSGR